jgi:hypothetical protein
MLGKYFGLKRSRLLLKWLTTFGLQNAGLFRRALVLPLLVRAAASESSKVRGRRLRTGRRRVLSSAAM